MERIASFSVDHTKLEPGMYISRTDGDVVTYDVRMKKPNGGDYLSNGSLHTIEHLFATYARNSAYKEHIIYIGPMGCRMPTPSVWCRTACGSWPILRARSRVRPSWSAATTANTACPTQSATPRR